MVWFGWLFGLIEYFELTFFLDMQLICIKKREYTREDTLY